MSDNFLQGWMRDRIEDSVTEGRRGEYKAGWLESMGAGMFGLDGQSVADDLKEADDNKAGEKALKGTGRSREQLGLAPGAMLTPEMVQGANANYTETKAGELREENKTTNLEVIAAGQKTGQEQIAAGERTSAAQIAAGDRRASENMTLIQQQMLNQSKESRLDRAERADQRADDRMMQMEMYERADRKDEKNRRRESIQALVAGLSSLGAAFAV